jgi:hypothetical protein
MNTSATGLLKRSATRCADSRAESDRSHGSVRRAGSRVRVTAQLITGADGSHLWSERYERELTDVFAIQDDIAQAIAGALHGQLSPRPGTVRHSPTLRAYDALLKGRHHMLGSRRNRSLEPKSVSSTRWRWIPITVIHMRIRV